MRSVVRMVLGMVRQACFKGRSFNGLFIYARGLFRAMHPRFRAYLRIRGFTRERSTGVVTFHGVARFRIFFFRPRRKQANRCSFRIQVAIMTRARFFTPFKVLGRLISRRGFSTAFLGLINGICSTVPQRVRVIRISRRAKAINSRFLFNMLRGRDNFSCTAYPFSAGRAIAPIGLIRGVTTGKNVNILGGMDIYTVR